MPVVAPERLVKLQNNADVVRNICVLAHVDHGKTSLTDSLIATNGIISPKLAGKIRYLDSRPDEQIRGITMESSAISLFFSLMRRQDLDGAPQQTDYLINLIDSPGHVDFSSEVSTASRLCDGALVLVDAVEGVCSQTVTVLRQTWIEHLKPVLVINKMDRLVTELKMSPGEAYVHLSKLLEQVNAIMGSFYQGERMEDDLKWRERLESRANAASAKADMSNDQAADGAEYLQDEESVTESTSYEEKGDEDIYFEPERGNVIFGSALDGWAFTVRQFAGFYEKKLGIKKRLLEKVLWGDYYLDPKTKRILSSKHLKGRSLKPMFVQLVLDNIWAVYEGAQGGEKGKGDAGKVEKITRALSLNLPPHVLRSKDPRAVLIAIVSAWIPLSTAVLVTVIEQLPSPKVAQEDRMEQLLNSSPGANHIDPSIRKGMIGLERGKGQPVVAFVSKMVSVAERDLPENKSRSGATLTAEEARELGRRKRAEIARVQAAINGESPDVAELRESLRDTGLGQESNNEEEDQPAEKEVLIGFARLFSGTLAVGDEVFVLGPKFNPAKPTLLPQPEKVTVTGLYLMMGRALESLTTVPAGVVFGIAGLEGHVMKSATLCSKVEGGVNLAGLSMGSQPIVRVALEPENPTDLDKMITGLRLLEQSDPCAVYEVLDSGEHVILTAGELHLERCLKDLRERFARCEINAGTPIVPYRESIVRAEEMNPLKNKDLPRGTISAAVTSGQIHIRLRVRPLPLVVTEFLLKHAHTIKQFYAERQAVSEDSSESDDTDETSLDEQELHPTANEQTLAELRSGLSVALKGVKNERDVWSNILDRIISFGPRRSGPNILIDSTAHHCCRKLTLATMLQSQQGHINESEDSTNGGLTAQDFADKITYAFQLATAQGPLCNEPMQGVAVFLEEVTLSVPSEEGSSARDKLGRLTGEVIKTVRESVRQGFLDWSPRLLLAMYSCEIQASTEVLGRVYGVITRRRGHIISESMNEGTPFFTIVAVIPVAEAFGFSDEIRKRTSGAASPQLIFSGYEMLDEDPFWVPFTEEELEDLGELADKENVAKRYMDGVRRRKGLFVGKKLVESGEKQKTLKR